MKPKHSGKYSARYFPNNNLFDRLSVYEEYEKRLSKLQENESFYQREIDRLTEERDQLNNLSQGNEQAIQIDAETQTTTDQNS